MNKLFETVSAASFMGGYDGGTVLITPMHMRNRMVFAPDTGEGSGKGEEGKDKSGLDRMREALSEEEKAKAAHEDAEKAKKLEEQNKNKDTQQSPEEAKHLKEVMKWKSRARELEEKMKEFEGLDAAEIRDLMEKSRDAERKQLEAQQALEEQKAREAGDFDKLKANMAKEHAKQMKALEEQLKERDSEKDTLNKRINDLTIGSAFTNSSFVRNNLTLPPAKARIIYGSYFDLDEQGRVVGYDKPKGAADRQPIIDGSGEPVGFEEAFKKIVEADPDKDDILRSTVRAGTGSRPVDTTVKAPPMKITGTQRIALALKEGGKS